MTQKKLNDSNGMTAPPPVLARLDGKALRFVWKLLPPAKKGLSA
jgi:hypothetical protein